MDNLINKLPSFYDNSNIVSEMQKSFTFEKNILEKEIQELINQLFVETATWGLNFWEDFLKIPINETLSVEKRRARVKAKITKAIPPLTKNQINNILLPYFESIEVNEYAKENRFEVILGTSTVIDSDLYIAINEIEELKPAHLEYSLGIKYINELIVNKIFNRWNSDVIPSCGTLVCSASDNDEFISTLGRKFGNALERISNNFFSDIFKYASENEYIIGDGKVYIETITNHINNMSR